VSDFVVYQRWRVSGPAGLRKQEQIATISRAECRSHCDRHAPRQNAPACPVEHHSDIHEAARHRDVRNAYRPNLVRAVCCVPVFGPKARLPSREHTYTSARASARIRSPTYPAYAEGVDRDESPAPPRRRRHHRRDWSVSGRNFTYRPVQISGQSTIHRKRRASHVAGRALGTVCLRRYPMIDQIRRTARSGLASAGRISRSLFNVPFQSSIRALMLLQAAPRAFRASAASPRSVHRAALAPWDRDYRHRRFLARGTTMIPCVISSTTSTPTLKRMWSDLRRSKSISCSSVALRPLVS
jgi:hypothetical protein